MMIPLKQVLEMTAKAPIEGCKGRIVSIDKYYQSKPDAATAWTKQDIELSDGVVRVPAQIWNHDPIDPSWKNREITILSHVGAKGLSGVYAHDDDYNPKKIRRIIKVTETGELAPVGAAEPQAPPPPAEKPPQAPLPQQEQRPASSGTVKPPRSKEQILADREKAAAAAKRAVAQRAHLMYLCLSGTVYAGEQAFIASNGNYTMSEESVQKIAVSLFISCIDAGLHQDLSPDFHAKKKDEPK